MRKRLTSALLALCLVTATHVYAQTEDNMMVKGHSGIAIGDPVNANMCHPDGVAVGGYDLVSYRSEEGPIMGRQQFEQVHEGVTYRFANADNLSAFRENPDYYLPAYSGFCAITLALGRVTCPDFTNFKIEDDQLLLFEVTGFTNGRTLWNSDVDTFRMQANQNFQLLTGE